LLDNEIINLFYERSEQAIMELSNKYGSVCRKVAKNILNNDLDAEECVNDTFLGAWNTIPPQKPASFGALSYSSGIIYRRGLNQVFLTGLWKHALQKRAQCPEPIHNAPSALPKPSTQF
jgi:hypothetical protein